MVMNNKRSSLNPLNQGRRRRPTTTISELNRTLDSLEGRHDHDYPRHGEPDHELRRRMESLSRGNSRRVGGYDERATRRDQGIRAVARDIERLRAQEDAMAATSRIAGELTALRDELKAQMNTGFRQEFSQLKRDLEDVILRAQENGRSGAFIAELERLSDAVAEFAPRGDERSFNMLRLEIEQLRSALDDLAKQETVDQRWSQVDRRLDQFEARFDRAPRGPDMETFDALADRLDQIARSVATLPDSTPIRSLEDRMRSLSDTVASYARRQDNLSAETLALMEARLDEISQAILASTTARSSHAEPELFERIEARISALARQIDEVAAESSSIEVMEQVSVLSDKVDRIAERVELPEQIMEHFADQLTVISRKLDEDARPGAAEIIDGFESRFTALSDILDRRQNEAIAHSHSLFRELEGRLTNVADRLDRREADLPQVEADMLAVIDQRFAEIAGKLDKTGPSDDTAIQGLEQRLDEIATRLNQSNAMIAQVDPDLVGKLERQVQSLSTHLAQPAASLPDFDDIKPRLDQMERSIDENREAVIEAARRAAEDAARRYSGSEPDSVAVAELAGDLRSLEVLTRKADERNSKTFEAIHDTLLKIVDRLGSVEAGSRAAAATATSRLDLTPPAIDPQDHLGADMMETLSAVDTAPRHGSRPAAETAAVAALKDEKAGKTPVGDSKRSLLSGISRAIFKEREKPKAAAKPAAKAEKPQARPAPAERIDPKLANQPLEPGSGAPDLNAIMRRVRDEAAPRNLQEAETAKSDFIAAARRAAQAAAAEAQMNKSRNSDAKENGGSTLGGLFKNRSRPIMIGVAAILIAIAGMQLSNAFMGKGSAPEARYAAAELPRTQGSVAEAEQAEMELAETDDQDFDSLESGDMAEADIVEPVTPPARMVTEARPDSPADTLPADETLTAAVQIPVEAGPVALREAAEGNDPKALFEIGSRYAEGRGVKADMAGAAIWYEKAAGLGLAPAQYRIGNFYEKGTGVSRDIAKAKSWYEKAASQGNASAMHNLAVLHAMGADGVTDNEKAAKWFLEAAEIGVRDSQFNLGILAAKGVGMPQNLEESYKWFALVAQSGDRDAEAKRDEIANALRPEQLERARQATQLWKPRTPDAAANEVIVPDVWSESNDTTAGIDLKKAVLNIQTILNKNGYEAGAADGVMGERTRSAIARFQSDNGMDPTGDITEPLVRALLERK